MNRWAEMLGALPATLQRLIARSQRISLPRRCDAAERVGRLRSALCHGATVRATYAWLPPEVQAALQELRARQGGISPAELELRYGPVRSWTQLAIDPRPRSISERLILLGWLVPRPAAPHNPARLLLPPELRRWLPTPLCLQSLGAPPPASVLSPPLAVRAAATLLLACAMRPLPVCADGTLSRAALPRLLPALAPLAEGDGWALCRWLWPLLQQLGLLVAHGGAATLAPAATRFLQRSAADQGALLREAWLAAPQPDPAIAPLLIDQTGMDWALLRRKLLAWAEALPADHCLDPAPLFGALTAACGPLADTHTHGFRRVERVPWQQKRAAAVWDATLCGPLTWLGVVEWTTLGSGEAVVVRRGPAPAPVGDESGLQRLAWRYDAPGLLQVPHVAVDAHLLRLLPFLEWHAADEEATTYRLSRASMARAVGNGESAAALWDGLAQRAGALPAGWSAGLERTGPTIRIAAAVVVTADAPAELTRASKARSVERALAGRLAPGIALAQPARVAALAAALARQGCAVEVDMPAAPLAAETVRPGDAAALLMACAFYRQHAPPDAPLLPDGGLELRLRAALPPALRDSTEAVLRDLAPRRTPPADAIPWQAPAVALPPAPLLALDLPPAVPLAAQVLADERVPEHTALARLRRAIATRQTVALTYTDQHGEGSQRLVRPLEVYERGAQWYLRAYCTLAQAERTFRVDRINQIAGATEHTERTEQPAFTSVPSVCSLA